MRASTTLRSTWTRRRCSAPNAGPIGAPECPSGAAPSEEALERGVRDMVRISDARMSGTSYGACVLHVAPESFVGGPLALVRDGDTIRLDVPSRTLSLVVSDEELAARAAAWTPPPPKFERGFGLLYSRHVMQADVGCDFDFLDHAQCRTRRRARDSLRVRRRAPHRPRARRARHDARPAPPSRRRSTTSIGRTCRSSRPSVEGARLDPVQMGLLFSAFAWSYAIANCPAATSSTASARDSSTASHNSGGRSRRSDSVSRADSRRCSASASPSVSPKRPPSRSTIASFRRGSRNASAAARRRRTPRGNTSGRRCSLHCSSGWPSTTVGVRCYC